MTNVERQRAREDRARDDLRVVRAALAGDRGAGEELAQRMRTVPRLLRGINGRRGQPLSDHDLEDLAQDVAIQIWEKLQQFRGLGTLEGYSYRFCTYAFMNRVRREKKRGERMSATEPDDRSASAREVRFDTEAIEHTLCSLSPEEEEVLRLKHYEDMSFTELGRHLGISPNTVKARYYKGLQELRRRLAPRFQEAR